MPWFPDFFSAVELARRQTRADGLADPVGEYFNALTNGDPAELESIWPGEVVVYDPRAGEIRGHRQLRRFVRNNQLWLAERHASTTTLASTCIPGRAVVELLVRLAAGSRPSETDHDQPDLQWPVAVVAESTSDTSVVFRTYCSQWPVDGQRPVRPPILPTPPFEGGTGVGDVVAKYQSALAAGDVDGVLETFAEDGYYREPSGRHPTHRGAGELRKFFARQFSAGGIGIQCCAVTDDGVRCGLEFNCVRWGEDELPAQAGLCVFERGPDGLLVAVRRYDDIQAPVGALRYEDG
ncbi:MAG: nuclear transport factor 2 family protein [Nakamurella sp.]